MIELDDDVGSVAENVCEYLIDGNTSDHPLCGDAGKLSCTHYQNRMLDEEFRRIVG